MMASRARCMCSTRIENLITAPTPVSFELSGPSGTAQTRIGHDARRRSLDGNGLHDAGRSGQICCAYGGVSSTRMIGQVPGDPCGLKMSARQSGQQLELETDPVRDCSGNAVPDGTIVTFTETYNGDESTVDVPLKRGIAKVEMPAHPGATISVASGVVLGNQIRWEKISMLKSLVIVCTLLGAGSCVMPAQASVRVEADKSARPSPARAADCNGGDSRLSPVLAELGSALEQNRADLLDRISWDLRETS